MKKYFFERDFTLTAYELLLNALRRNGYGFLTYEDYLTRGCEGKQIILRHDVDDLPQNSLRMAAIEYRMGIRSTYYFRIVNSSNDPEVIRAIMNLDHEIGYHYEDLAEAEGDKEEAILAFRKNLEYFRTFYPVRTICMHGSPLTPWDNRKLWEEYSYAEYGIIGEPYFETDFNKIFYLTDTGRRWNGENMSVRDKVTSSYSLEFRSTADIIERMQELPDQIMVTTHPQRWDDRIIPWTKEIIFQNIKNQVKKFIINS